jgi:hypothetical protein
MHTFVETLHDRLIHKLHSLSIEIDTIRADDPPNLHLRVYESSWKDPTHHAAI